MWLVVGIPRIRKCKPRASGDDPEVLAALVLLSNVNPARAGMILSNYTIELRKISKPRASGDDPSSPS